MTEIRPAREEDFQLVHELLARHSRAAVGVSEVSEAQLRQRWQLPGFEVGADSWVVVDGTAEIVGYAAVDASQELDLAAADSTAADALLARAEQRARGRGFDHLSLTLAGEDGGRAALAGRAGFMLERTVLRMWRSLGDDLPRSQLPGAVVVRTFEPGDAPAVQALLDAAYSAWDPDYVPRPHDEWLAFMTDHDEFDPALWFLAERDGELVGCSLFWAPSHGHGWLKDLAVRDRDRGRGLATALLVHGLQSSAQRGASRVGLKVDASNPTGAPALYERLGFTVDRRYEIWSKRL
jgi:mycothiol synthase